MAGLTYPHSRPPSSGRISPCTLGLLPAAPQGAQGPWVTPHGWPPPPQPRVTGSGSPGPGDPSQGSRPARPHRQGGSHLWLAGARVKVNARRRGSRAAEVGALAVGGCPAFRGRRPSLPATRPPGPGRAQVSSGAPRSHLAGEPRPESCPAAPPHGAGSATLWGPDGGCGPGFLPAPHRPGVATCLHPWGAIALGGASAWAGPPSSEEVSTLSLLVFKMGARANESDLP